MFCCRLKVSPESRFLPFAGRGAGASLEPLEPRCRHWTWLRYQQSHVSMSESKVLVERQLNYLAPIAKW